MMVGNIIREQRKKKKLTLEVLATQVGLTPGGLSQIERGVVNPSLTALQKLAKALDVSMNVMFAEENSSYVSRKDHRRKAIFSDMDVDYEFLTPRPRLNGISPKIEVVQVSLRPKASGHDSLSQHEADECFVVIHGTIEVQMADEVIALNEGDSIYLSEGTMHRLYNPTDEESVGFSILSSMIY